MLPAKDGKRPSLAIVVGMGKPKGGPEEGSPEEEREESPEEAKSEGDYEPNEDQTAAGSDLADAIKSGDGAAIAKAFMALRELC